MKTEPRTRRAGSIERRLTGCLLPAAITLGLVGSAQTSSAVVVLNPSFEAGTGADADNWTEIEVAVSGATATADRVMSDAATGDYSMYLEVIGNASSGPVAEIQQQTIVGSVTPGSSYDFSFSAKGVAGPGTVAFYEVQWFDGDGSNGGGPQGSATGLQTFGLGGSYAPVGMMGLIAPATADSAFVSIRIVTGAFDGASGSANIDDVSFETIPEPASTGLVALGGLLLLTRRRVRR